MAGLITIFRSGGGSTFTEVATGGMVYAGSAGVEHVKAAVATGGMVYAGVAGHALVKLEEAAGGIVFSGAAVVEHVKAVSGVGGLTFSGAADVQHVPAGQQTEGGGIRFPFLWGVTPRVFQHIGRGGLRFGGSARVAVEIGIDHDASLLGLELADELALV